MSALAWTKSGKPADYRFIDLTGHHYGRLEVVMYAGRGKSGQHVWRCQCDCGADTVVRGAHLRSGAILSCGCHRVAVASSARLKHGCAKKGAKSPEYRSWINMRERCGRPSNNRFHAYGARGVVVCDRWTSFENFLEDMGPRPSREHSIDRINVDGNYEPSNCRWATPEQQQRNTSRSVRLELDGVTRTAIELANEFGVPYAALLKRIGRGWSVKDAVSKPMRRTR